MRQVADDSGQDDRAATARAHLAPLTEREREVARAIGQGHSNAQISQKLHMALPTVKAHVSRILTQLGLNNRVQIAWLVHDANDPEDT